MNIIDKDYKKIYIFSIGDFNAQHTNIVKLKYIIF